MWDLLLVDCVAATLAPGPEPLGVIRDAAIGIEHGRIAFVGERARAGASAREVRSLEGAFVTPGLIDCHTHLVFGGNRASEWRERLTGASYEEIARRGGGILSTVAATRAANLESLAQSAAMRARMMATEGVTTIEIKSGYGLDLANEKKMLEAAARVAALAHVRVSRTFLGAHALPSEFKSDRKAYVDLVADTMIPVIARENLADAVDVFVEEIAFSREEAERIFTAAKNHGLKLKVHAGQLSDSGGAALAAKFDALSADHLEHLSESDAKALAASGTVAVLLPCAHYFLNAGATPPVEMLRRNGVAMAVATDCNPGTAPSVSPLLALNMASTLFRLTPEEALEGMTVNAAKALGLESEVGTIEQGKSADLAVWSISEPAELAYWMGAKLLKDRYFKGVSDRHGKPA
jgi:imidazolonepropionase